MWKKFNGEDKAHSFADNLERQVILIIYEDENDDRNEDIVGKEAITNIFLHL